MKVLIIGGGIAGPALALALTRAGHNVEIYDRVEPPPATTAGAPWTPADIGGAILLNENVLRVFKHLGVLEQVVAAGTKVYRRELAGFDGRSFAVFENFDGPEFVTTGVLRSTVARVLYSALNAAGVFLKVGKKLVAIDQATDGALGVVAHFLDGTKAYGDILVGADGINSATRALLFPDVEPKRSQYCGYFAVSPLDGEVAPDVFTVMMDNRTGNYAFIMPSGPSMIHWGLFESRPQANDNDSWDLGADLVIERDRMLTIAEKWNLPPRFRALVEKTTRVIRVNFTSIPPMPTWHKQNCVVIGDAAHALLPFIAQGAGMSLEDSLALSILLDKLPDRPTLAFELLHELRAERVAKVAAKSEVLGQRTSGSSAASAAIGHLTLKVLSFVARQLRYNSNDEIVRYDCHAATLKLLAAKGLAAQ